MMHSNFLSFDVEISEAVKAALLSVFKSSQWSEGKYTQKLEEFYELSYQSYASAFSSGGQAMAAIAQFYKHKKCVAFQSNTYYASIHPWLNHDHSFILIKSESQTLMPTYSQIEYVVNSYAIDILVLTHIGGYPNPDIGLISQLCRDNNIILIEDCAHAPFTGIYNKYVGTYGDASIISFYPTKPIPAGEGGVLLTSCKALSDFSKAARNYGKYRDEYGNILHSTLNLGNARISEYNAAVAYSLSVYNEPILSRRRQIASCYDQALPSHITRYSYDNLSTPSFYKYVVLVDVEGIVTSPVYDSHNQLHSILSANNIPFADPFPDLSLPLHSCLPVFPSMSEEFIGEVVSSLSL